MHHLASLDEAIQLVEDHLVVFPGVGQPPPSPSLFLSHSPPFSPCPFVSLLYRNREQFPRNQLPIPGFHYPYLLSSPSPLMSPLTPSLSTQVVHSTTTRPEAKAGHFRDQDLPSGSRSLMRCRPPRSSRYIQHVNEYTREYISATGTAHFLNRGGSDTPLISYWNKPFLNIWGISYL